MSLISPEEPATSMCGRLISCRGPVSAWQPCSHRCHTCVGREMARQPGSGIDLQVDLGKLADIIGNKAKAK